MQEGELIELVHLAKETNAACIILDSIMSAFPAMNPSKITEVMGPFWYLRRLATETGACVVLIDHLPKPMSGETAGARGVIGSVAKPAQARAVHVLTRVPPKEVEGRNVLRWDRSENGVFSHSRTLRYRTECRRRRCEGDSGRPPRQLRRNQDRPGGPGDAELPGRTPRSECPTGRSC